DPNVVLAVLLLPVRATERSRGHRDRLRPDLAPLSEILVAPFLALFARVERHLHGLLAGLLKHDLSCLKVAGDQYLRVGLPALFAGESRFEPEPFLSIDRVFADDRHFHRPRPFALLVLALRFVHRAFAYYRLENIRDVRFFE